MCVRACVLDTHCSKPAKRLEVPRSLAKQRHSFAGIIRPKPGSRYTPLLKPWITPPPPAHDPYHPWLVFPGSLTARITACLGAMRVEVRFQGARRPARDEARLIGLQPSRLAHVREVVLTVAGTPVVFAHSVAAPRDLKGAWRALGHLGNRPLAAALFADPRVRRQPLEFRHVRASHYLHARVRAAGLTPPPVLWARRSLFRFRGKPLLVTEVFLPAIVARDGKAAPR